MNGGKKNKKIKIENLKNNEIYEDIIAELYSAKHTPGKKLVVAVEN